MINVTLRKRESAKSDRKILYLDFYPASVVNEKETRREYLGLFVFEKWKTIIKDGKKVIVVTQPKDQFDKSHNIETIKTAKMKRLNRYNELNKPEIYNAHEREQLKQKEIGEGSFTDYFKKYITKHQYNDHDSIVSVEKHLNTFAGGALKFSDITEKFCNGFKDYLTTAKNISNDRPLCKNTASLYFTKFKTVLKDAYKAGHLPVYFNDKLGAIGTDETRRNYLTMDELNKLAGAPCDLPILKRAALFSALTGLRLSDIEKLTWNEVETIKGNTVLNFTQRKTGGIEALPISKQAAGLLGERDQVKPFDGLNYDPHKNFKLKQWVNQAGINKKITFHCFRHTFATLQLSSGTDIYTVSKLLGHRDLKTTQVYAHVMKQAKQEAMNRITINFNTVKP